MYSPKVEGFIAAKSYLLKNAFEGEAPDFIINPALVKVSFGDLPLPAHITATLIADGQVQFSWSTEKMQGASAADQIMMLAYNSDQLVAKTAIAGQLRKTGADELTIDLKKAGTWHLYAAFVAWDRSRQSDCVYLGTVSV